MAVVENTPEYLLMVDDDRDGLSIRRNTRTGLVRIRPLGFGVYFMDKEERQALAAWLQAIDAGPRYEVRQIPDLNLWAVFDTTDPEDNNMPLEQREVFHQRSNAEALADKLNTGTQDRPVDHPLPTSADVLGDQLKD